MSDFKVIPQNPSPCRCAELKAELAAVKAENIKTNKKLKEIWEMFYGQNQAVVGWHLNGAEEPMDKFFEENDWDYDDELLKGGE